MTKVSLYKWLSAQFLFFLAISTCMIVIWVNDIWWINLIFFTIYMLIFWDLTYLDIKNYYNKEVDENGLQNKTLQQ